jgi:hypothetical protein
MIKFEASGRTGTEIHVDGRTGAQILTVPEEEIAAVRGPAVYLYDHGKEIERRASPHQVAHCTCGQASQATSRCLRRSAASMVNLGDLDAKAHATDCNLSFIDKACQGADHGLSGTAFVRGLIQYGLRFRKTGMFCAKTPPTQDE